MRADSERVLRVVVEIYRLVSLMGWDGMGREDEIPAKQQRSAAPFSRHGHAGTSRKEDGMEQGKHSNSTGTGQASALGREAHTKGTLSQQQLSSNLQSEKQTWR